MNAELLEKASDKILLSKGWNEMADYAAACKLAEAILRVAVEACAEIADKVQDDGLETANTQYAIGAGEVRLRILDLLD